ncbi:MAG: hypothetical protein AB1656_26980 [Candidatus Omnitrophota bacterium]
MMKKYRVLFFIPFCLGGLLLAEAEGQNQPIQINGVFPSMTTIAGRDKNISEAGFGALLPWSDRLWAVSYVSHIKGTGTGLFEIGEEMQMIKRPESVVGTYANRMIHYPSNQGIIGPHIISATGEVRTFDALKSHRLTATVEHLFDPQNKVYFLTMEGLLFEANVYTLEAKQLFNLVQELELPHGVNPHFKGAYTGSGRLVVANNTYHEQEYLGKREGGRLAEWDGEKWTILEKKPFVEVAGKGPRAGEYGSPIFALGWDNASVILKLFAAGEWKTYRLPKGSHSFDHAWNTEWFRIREAQTERFLMDAHGIFYEMPVQVYEGKVWSIKPICYHLRMVPDFCYWRGLFVMAGNQTDLASGQPQSGLWFGNIDDLWQYGKSQGWGGPWREEPVKAGAVSDPFLMTGFDKKGIHLSHDSDQQVQFTIEVDFLGNGTWKTYEKITVPPQGYSHYEFPEGFSAHWVRVKVSADCKATVYFVYT